MTARPYLPLPPPPLQPGRAGCAAGPFRGGGRRRGRGLRLGLMALAILAAWAPRVNAQPSMQTILTNGPVSNRLNMVVLSEAYTTNVLGQFLIDATNAVNALLSYQPYAEYR